MEYKEYIVKQPFMARKGQFGENHELCIGIETSALKQSPYRCYLGKNRNSFYNVTFTKAMEIVTKFGQKNVIWTVRGKTVFILPVSKLEYGQHKKETTKNNKPEQIGFL